MALELLQHERMLRREQGFCIERIAAVLGFERTGRPRHADQHDRAAKHQGQTEKSQGNPPGTLTASRILARACNANPGKVTKWPHTGENYRTFGTCALNISNLALYLVPDLALN